MGVPAFFRWLSRKYSSLIVNCVEEKPRDVSGVTVPVDTSKPNPNDIEFDNLYLDMNGIIHPCCHPEDKPAPKNEDEMMILIFEFIDRIFSIVRPRRVLYMAIDGVAPRAKMNQQRSRRFRASKETAEKIEDMSRIREEVLSKGMYLPPEKPKGEHFDSNCITPGTPFMFKLAECLRYYVHDRINNDPGWQGIKVILSDANVPGEGEHKIMDYIRRQRAQPEHDPNTHHCLCGADADLIMLGLATHEPNFTIIREEFKPNQPRPCDLCGQMGHELKNCEGMAKEPGADESMGLFGAEQQFIFVRLCVLREYLQSELEMPNLPFEYDFERALDDWVFMCFFVGNDFLPHLPSLEIREGAIDRLVKLYKNTVYKTGGYLTDSGVVNLSRVQLVMSDLGKVEDEIFKKRRQTELDFRRRDKMKKQRMRQQQLAQRPKWMMGGQFAPQAPGRSGPGSSSVSNPRQAAYESRKQNMSGGGATAELKSMLTREGEDQRGQKRRPENQGGRGGDDSDEEQEPADDVRLWEDGWKDRYYKSKFDVDPDDLEFRYNVARHYVRGLCWVLRYYYQGCASWKWYFPYHYAPFASDFVNIGDLANDFEKNTQPFKPLEQLMGVFPAASKKHLPITFQTLMEDPESPIIDFYPTDFKIDLNGKKYAWQGVALLPFVDETRLHKALESVYPDLTPQERKRNTRGSDRLFIGASHPSYDFLEGLYEGGGTTDQVPIDPKLTKGMAGNVWCDEYNIEKGGVVPTPLPDVPDIHDNKCITVCYLDPVYDADFLFPAKVLPGAVMPAPTLKPGDWNSRNQGQRYRPQLGFQPNSGYRDNKDMSSAMRMVRNATGMGGQGFVMSSQNMMPTMKAGLMGAAPGLMGAGPGLMGAGPGGGGQSRYSNQGHQQQRSYNDRNQGYSGQGNQGNRNQNWGHNNRNQGQSWGNQGNQRGYQGDGGYQSYGNNRGSNYRSEDGGYQSYPSGQQRHQQGRQQHNPRYQDSNRGHQYQDHGQNERRCR
ncbi:5'-3' exoribonuclease 2 [Aplysia californica]|uniref:5'-3' exoribonuclease n=1 Tax=Aplysia californica TaxID=6500 RepID=A0ABM0ZUL0_APLCA|nr:5'-3' exoribonuclease 2 [Aplysia californica]